MSENQSAGQAGHTVEWDVFISHASEDKSDFVRPLARRLTELGLSVWFDETTLKVGDSLRRSIDKGLARSRFGIVVISPAFLEKEWPQKELDGLAAKESDGIKVILPVWHKVSADQVRRYSPTLADKLAVSSDQGLDTVARRLIDAIEGASIGKQSTPRTTSIRAVDKAEFRERAAQFHASRVAQIAAGDAPANLLDRGQLVVHLAPANDIDSGAALFDDIAAHPELFLPLGSRSVMDNRIDYEGLLIGSNSEGLSKPQRAYVYVFRSGVIESVVALPTVGGNDNFTELPRIQAMIIKSSTEYCSSLQRIGIKFPVARWPYQ